MSRRIVALAALLLPVALSAGACAQESEKPLRLTFLDVGQGDATLLQSADGKTALVDAGRGEDLAGRLEALGVGTIDLLVASHADADHIGGMLDVIRRMPVRYFLDNGIPHNTQTYLSLMREVRARPDITYLTAEPRTIALGDAEIRVLPLPPEIDGIEDQNDESVGLVVAYGDFHAFLSGDSEKEELSWWIAHDDVPAVTVLKAPHHGSDNGYTQAFLVAARPEVIVVSVGPNSYGHPMPEALAAYRSMARRVYRTDREGDVTVLGFRDGHFEVRTGRDSAAVVSRPSRGPGSLTGVAAGGAGAGVGSAQGRPAGSRSAEGTSVAAPVGISVFADAPGNDHYNLNGEYVTLANPTDRDIPLAGWMLCDAARHCYRFPRGAVLRAQGRVILYTGSGTPDAVHFYMGSGRAVWNNDGDTATLYDAAGRIIGRYAYE